MRCGTTAPAMDAAESAAGVAAAEQELSAATVTFEDARGAATSAGRDAKEVWPHRCCPARHIIEPTPIRHPRLLTLMPFYDQVRETS